MKQLEAARNVNKYGRKFICNSKCFVAKHALLMRQWSKPDSRVSMLKKRGGWYYDIDLSICG